MRSRRRLLGVAALVAFESSKAFLSPTSYQLGMRNWTGQSSLFSQPPSTTQPVGKTQTSSQTHRWRRPWTYAELSPHRRKQVIKHVTELEEGQQDHPTYKGLQRVEASLDVLAQWARLGEGQRAESACICMELAASLEDPRAKVKAYRRVLHAWCNELSRLSSRHINRKQRTPSEDIRQKEIAERAEFMLEKMEAIGQEELLEGDDFLAVIQVQAQCLQVASALHVLKKWQSSASSKPTASAYAVVIRCILAPSCPVRGYDRMGSRLSPVEMAHALLEQCTEECSPAQPSLSVYNRLLDAWSKSLPPFSKKRSPLRDDSVVEKVEWIWNKMPLHNARSHTLMIYALVKSGNVEKAYGMWKRLLEHLLASNEHEKVDSRSFRMLVNALSTIDDMEAPNRIESILGGMWKLYEAGHKDTAPDVFLYTTAMNSWAQHGNVNKVRSLMNDLESQYETHHLESLQSDVATYNALIHAISKHDDVINAAEEAGSAVKIMKREAEACPKVQPDTITYNTLIDACLAANSDKGRERAEQTLRWMVDEHKSGNTRVKPNLKSYSSVVQAWAVAGSPDRAEPLLDLMEELYRPPAFVYEIIITAWCNKADFPDPKDSVRRANRLLHRMQDLYEASGNEALRPSMSLYNTVIRALKRSGNESEEAVDVVTERRDRMYPRLDSTLEPRRLTSSKEVFGLLKLLENAPSIPLNAPETTRNFNTVLSLLAKSNTYWAGQRAEDILNYMLERSLKRNIKDLSPNIVTFNTVMAAWARSSHPNAGQKAEGVLGKLDSLHHVGVLEDVKADRVSYNTVMSAYARSGDPQSGSHAEKLFRELELLYHETKDEALRPGIFSFTTLLNAWARGGEPGSAERAEQILLRMLKEYKANQDNIKPNTLCFNEVIYAWARSPDESASNRAEMVLQLMQDMYTSSNEEVMPTTRTFNLVLYALANSNDDDAPIRAELILDRMRKGAEAGNYAVKPDLTSYTTVVSAWARRGGPGSVNATLKLLDDLDENDLEPDPKFFANVIYSLARTGSKEAPAAAEKIVADLKWKAQFGDGCAQANTEIYNSLINCWAKSGGRGAASRAEAILQEMEDQSYKGKTFLIPTVETYTSVIDAFAKSCDVDSATRAEAILNRMEDEGRVLPNAHTYTAVIQSYARSDMPCKSTHAQAILQRMKGDYAGGNEEARPTIVVYNALLNACEFAGGDELEMEKAFEVACVALDEVKSSDHLSPDDVTYGTFLGVAAKLMPKSDSTNELVELVFKRCCVDGQVSPFVLKKLKDAVSISRYKKMLGSVDETKLPSKWTRNTARSKRAQGRS